MKNKLMLFDGISFYGFIGDEISNTVTNLPVCIGDTVRVQVGLNKFELTGIVGLFRDKYSVFGLSNTPISKMEVLEVIKCHDCLQLNDILQGGIRVEKFID